MGQFSREMRPASLVSGAEPSREAGRQSVSDPLQQRPEPIPPAILDPLLTTNLMCPAMKLRDTRARSRNWTPGT